MASGVGSSCGACKFLCRRCVRSGRYESSHIPTICGSSNFIRNALPRPKHFVKNQIPNSILNDAALNAAISLLPRHRRYPLYVHFRHPLFRPRPCHLRYLLRCRPLIHGDITYAVKQKKLFILDMDYHDLLLPLVNRVNELEGTVFFLTPGGCLMPVAIELTRPRSAIYSIPQLIYN
nr:linoleate 13S-lipoxygenase 2-1, chloroplastic-like [Ipomoea batatas]